MGTKLAPARKAMLDAHNKVRAQVGVGPMTWSPTLAAYAQSWAERLKAKRNCGLEHRSGSHKRKSYGENLAAYSGTRPPADAVGMWASERKDYRDGAPIDDSNWLKVGHYTQIVWRSTTQVGCGWASCGASTVVVCNYDPPGNVMGRRPY